MHLPYERTPSSMQSSRQKENLYIQRMCATRTSRSPKQSLHAVPRTLIHPPSRPFFALKTYTCPEPHFSAIAICGAVGSSPRDNVTHPCPVIPAYGAITISAFPLELGGFLYIDRLTKMSRGAISPFLNAYWRFSTSAFRSFAQGSLVV